MSFKIIFWSGGRFRPVALGVRDELTGIVFLFALNILWRAAMASGSPGLVVSDCRSNCKSSWFC